MRDCRDMNDRVHIGQRVVAGMVAERPFHAALGGVNLSLDDELGVFGHFDVNGFGFHQMDRTFAQKTGKQHLVNAGRKRRGGGIRDSRIAAKHNRHVDLLLFGLVTPRMFRADLVHLPVHARRALVEHLNAVHADVALARIRVIGEHKGQGDVAPAVLRPAVQNGQLVQINVVACIERLPDTCRCPCRGGAAL